MSSANAKPAHSRRPRWIRSNDDLLSQDPIQRHSPQSELATSSTISSRSIMAGPCENAGSLTTVTNPCGRSFAGQAPWWHLLRWIVDHLLPCWSLRLPTLRESVAGEARNVTGTIICPQNERVRLCLQKNSACSPILILDLPLHTADLAEAIREGASRIALESFRTSPDCCGMLLDVPAWATFCNGRRAGFAARRAGSEGDAWVLDRIRTVSAGAGFIPGKTSGSGWFYLRGNFRRVVGSTDAEAYHLLDPSGTLGQELSIFFLRF